MEKAATESSELKVTGKLGEFKASRKWFLSNRESLAQRYPDEFVAIVRNRVIDHDSSFDALARRLFSKHRVPRLFVGHTTREQEVIRL